MVDVTPVKSPVDSLMNAGLDILPTQNCHAEVEFVSGQVLRAVLLEDLHARMSSLKVFVEHVGALQKYALSDICTIRIVDDLKVPWPEEARTLQVTTVTGNIYRVNVWKEYLQANGFFGIPVDPASPYRLIFFTAEGTKARCEENPVGQMLLHQGLIENETLEEVLAEQKRLRQRKIGEIISAQTALSRQDIEGRIQKAKAEGRHPRFRVGDLLMEAGLITKEQLTEALAEQKRGVGKKLGDLLVEKGLITEEQLIRVLAKKFRIPFVDLTKEVPNPRAMETLPLEVVQQLKIFPLFDDGVKLVVATSEPTNYGIYDYLRFYTGRRIELVAATSKQIEEAIRWHYPQKDTLADTIIESLSFADDKEKEEEEEGLTFSEADSYIISIVNKIMLDAYNKGASDIHLEPGVGDRPLTIRYRIDGILRIAHQIPNSCRRALVSRLKIMAHLDIAERRKPQSGKILIKYHHSKIEYRLEITPTVGGNEDAVLRILSVAKPLPLEAMGFSPRNLQAFTRLLDHPYGIILCVGPTGSGKTTTLHAALSKINTEERKIWTVEDPVEIVQPGLRQVQVIPKIGLTFAEVLRSFLRADPDVIMIGEMRDFETAKTAIEASLTGHLVLSTLHTNSAIETIQRLIEMGVDHLNFADALLGILAQRLARRLCDKCKTPYQPSPEEYERMVYHYNAYWWERHGLGPYRPDVLLWRRVGCHDCNGTGYRGRLAIHELVMGTKSLKQIIKDRAHIDKILDVALEEGMRTLLMDGISKVLQGHTDMEQVFKVCITSTVSEDY